MQAHGLIFCDGCRRSIPTAASRTTLPDGRIFCSGCTIPDQSSIPPPTDEKEARLIEIAESLRRAVKEADGQLVDSYFLDYQENVEWVRKFEEQTKAGNLTPAQVRKLIADHEKKTAPRDAKNEEVVESRARAKDQSWTDYESAAIAVLDHIRGTGPAGAAEVRRAEEYGKEKVSDPNGRRSYGWAGPEKAWRIAQRRAYEYLLGVRAKKKRQRKAAGGEV